MHEANIIPFLFYLMNLQSQTLSVDILANIFTAFYSMIKVRVQKREIVSFHQKDKRDVTFLKFILVKLRWNERHNEMVEFEWDLDTYILNHLQYDNNIFFCISLDPAKLASVITEIVGNVFVNEEEVNRPFSLASKRQFAKV